MTSRAHPRVLSIPSGVPFLSALADGLLSGRLVESFRYDGDPLALADVTIYVPTRRAARELRSVFMDRAGAGSVILPTIRPLGEFDEDSALFLPGAEARTTLDPPISAFDRLLLLAPLVRLWKQRLPAHVAAKFAEEMIVPASAADAIWLARDLANLIDEVETEGTGWSKLEGLVEGELAGWWQVTLDFLNIVTKIWPDVLTERQRSNPAAHRNAAILAEAARLAANPPSGPVIAAGSTGSIPATAALLSTIARLPNGAVVLPGLDCGMDDRSWAVLHEPAPEPAVLGHPQFGLVKLLRRIGIDRTEVEEIAAPPTFMATRAKIVSEAFRPAETTDAWAQRRDEFSNIDIEPALAGVTLIEAANERDEAAAIAIALRQAIETPGRTAALVTSDRDLARRVSAELLRFGIRADDSGGTPLASTPPATLFRLMLSAVLVPGDPVPLLALLKHPLLSLGLERPRVRRAIETIELVALRGGFVRPDVTRIAALFDTRHTDLDKARRPPFWFARMSPPGIEDARIIAVAIETALGPLVTLVSAGTLPLADMMRASVIAFENLGRAADGSLDRLYDGDAGQNLASFLRGVLAAETGFDFEPVEWPNVFDALLATEVVKPAQGSDARVAIWGALEARLLSPDTLVVGGLNEGIWPRRAVADRFMSRFMKTGIDLEPPERRIGQSAHDFQMALGVGTLVLSRAGRSGDSPAVASRWLQRISAFVGVEQTEAMRRRGDAILALGRSMDLGRDVDLAKRPNPKPPLAARPAHFSVTEIETLRRDPYAIYARRILDLHALDPLVRDPGAADRGTLFHEILSRFSSQKIDPAAPDATERLVATGQQCFAEFALPADVVAVWWPRFVKLAANVIRWENDRVNAVQSRHPEEHAKRTLVARSGVTLSGNADRIDLLPGGMADIIDYKTGTSPSRVQAHRLIAPQLALEGALLRRGAFERLGKFEPADLAYIRLKANGEVVPESILEIKGSARSGPDLAEEAWARLEKLLDHYARLETGYRSRALPFRENDTDGTYDHLARVLEWSAGGEDAGEAAPE